MCMNPKRIREIQTNEVLRKRLAKYITLHCFRNTDVLEDLHSGEVPISESGDYSDVKVITPDREIPWSDLSRFDNSEMKAMMIDVVNHCDQVLAILFSAELARATERTPDGPIVGSAGWRVQARRKIPRASRMKRFKPDRPRRDHVVRSLRVLMGDEELTGRVDEEILQPRLEARARWQPQLTADPLDSAAAP